MLYMSQMTKYMTMLTDALYVTNDQEYNQVTDTLFVTDNRDMTRLSDNVSVSNEQVNEYAIRYFICHR